MLLPLYTAVLTIEEYGISDAIITTVSLLYPFLTLCITESVLRLTFENKYKKNVVFTNALAVILISTLILICFQPLVHAANISFAPYWYQFLLFYLLYNLEQCVSFYARALGLVRLIAIVGIIHTIVVIASNILFLVILHYRLNGYLFAAIIGNIVSIAATVIGGSLWRYFLPLKVSRQTMKEMLFYSCPLIVTTIAWWINTSADKYIVEYLIGIGQRGLYAVAYKIPLILTTLTTIFVDAWRLSAYEEQGNDQSRYFSNVYEYLNIFCVIICGLLIVFSKLLARFLFSKNFFSAWVCVSFLLIAFLFSTLSGFLASIFTKAKKTKALSVSTGIGCVVNIVLNFVLIPRFGILAAAFTTCIAFFLTWIIRLIQSRSILFISIRPSKTAVEYLCLFIMAAAMSFESSLQYHISVAGMAILLVVERKQIRTVCSVVHKNVSRIIRREN